MNNTMGAMMGNAVQSMFNNMFQAVIMRMMQQFCGGMGNVQNPQQMVNQMMQNPEVSKTAGPLINGKNPEQMQSTFYNLCRERGLDPRQVAKQYGINLPN